ncbi:hypothetical protein Tco_0311700, partial [Tanacetum coccineum]
MAMEAKVLEVGTEGVVGLTQWFERMETVFNISNCAVENQELALVCGRMFPEESDNIEKYVGGLPDMIHGSVMTSKPKTMQDAIEFATELMDKKIRTFVERQTENKRKFCDNHDLSRLDNQSIERDRLIGIGFVLNFVKFISLTFGDKEMISVIEASLDISLLISSYASSKCSGNPITIPYPGPRLISAIQSAEQNNNLPKALVRPSLCVVGRDDVQENGGEGILRSGAMGGAQDQQLYYGEWWRAIGSLSISNRTQHQESLRMMASSRLTLKIGGGRWLGVSVVDRSIEISIPVR